MVHSGELNDEGMRTRLRAIKAWQKSLGLEQTGVVEAGDIVFVPALPTRVSLDAKVVFRGATLAGGESVVSGLPASPSFSIPVTDTQAAMMPAGTRVDITSPQGTPWQGITGDQSRNPDTQTISVAVSGVDGAPVCVDACGQVPVTGASKLASRIVTVEKVAGLVVPSAALVTDANGTTAVVAEDGTRTTVTVVASARGMSVVDGVSAGQKVRIPAKGAGG